MDTNTILIVAAHPDDEVLGCGGMIAKYSSIGINIHVLFMTNGSSSREKSNTQIINKRKESAEHSAKLLGISSLTFCDFPDNKMDSTPLLHIVRKIEEIVANIQPNIIYTHHIGDLNIDHQITHKAVMTACRPQPEFCVKEIYSFEIPSSTEWQTPGHLSFTPSVYIDINDEMEIKRKALEAYFDEICQSPHARSIDNIVNLNALRGNSVGMNYAEAFMLIRSVRD
jgi:N-acetylglucosamine malate deacetylase 1